MAFLTALGTVLGQHIATIIAGAIVLGTAYIGLSPRGRLIVKGIRNYITSNASNNPKIAAGIFDEKLKELTATKRRTIEIAEKANGALTAELENEHKARKEYEEYSKKARSLESMGNHEEALVLARNAQKALNRAERYKANLPNLRVMAETASDRLKEIEAKISDTEERKQLAIDNIKKGNIEKEISEELMELNISEIDTSLKLFIMFMRISVFPMLSLNISAKASENEADSPFSIAQLTRKLFITTGFSVNFILRV